MRSLASPRSVVLVHHAAGGASDWRELQAALDGRVDVWAPDFPGHGDRLAEPPLGSIDAMVDWLAGGMRARSLGGSVVAGHSMGGVVALQLALQHPGLVGGLVLVSTGARLRVARALLQLVREHFAELPQRMVALGFSPSADPEVVRRWVEGPWPATPEAAASDFAACDGFDVRTRLGEVRIPVVVMVGEDDLMTPPKFSRELAAGIAGARLREFPACGHLLIWERPAEVAGEIVGLCGAGGGRGARCRMSKQAAEAGGPEKKYRRHPDVAHRIIDGQAVIVVPSTQSMHTLNEVGSFIWQACDGKTEAEIASAIVTEFDVDEPTARADFGAFATELLGKKMLVVE